MTKETYVLKMDHIVKEYFGNRVLKGVDLAVRPGEIHALMGENGAGKSTTMNIMTGCLSATKGSVKIDGFDILKNRPRQRNGSAIFRSSRPFI